MSGMLSPEELEAEKRWYSSNGPVGRRAHLLLNHIGAQAAEIERLRAQVRGALAGLVEVGEVLSCAPEESPLAAAKRIVAAAQGYEELVGALQRCAAATGKDGLMDAAGVASAVEDLRSERDALKAELASLTPTGQVAEDVRAVKLVLNADDTPPELMEVAADGALSQLAAKAQGYEAAVAAIDEDGAMAKGDTSLAGRIRALSEDRMGEKVRAERAEEERDAAVAEKDSLTIAYVDACTDRDAAVADSAALLFNLRGVIASIDRAGDRPLRIAIGPELRRTVELNHPGAALLKQMQEQAETIKALADALKKSATRDDNGPCWCPPRTGPSPHEDYCTERRTALDMVLKPQSTRVD